MQHFPPWYIALNEFGYIFHTAIDIAYIILGFAIVVVVSRPSWRQHLRWASPAAAASVLKGIGRLVADVHHYLHVGAMANTYPTSDLLYYTADALSLYSMFVFLKMLRDLIRHPASPDPLAEYPAQPGVWPPAPTVKR